METTSERRDRVRKTVCTPFMAMSVEDAAAVAGICAAHLYAMKAEGKGPRFKRLKGRTVVLLGDFESWMNNLPDA